DDAPFQEGRLPSLLLFHRRRFLHRRFGHCPGSSGRRGWWRRRRKLGARLRRRRRKFGPLLGWSRLPRLRLLGLLLAWGGVAFAALVPVALAVVFVEDGARSVAPAELPAFAVRRQAKAPAAACAAKDLPANLAEAEPHFPRALAGLAALAEEAADCAAGPEQDPESIQCRAATCPRARPARGLPDCPAGTRNRNCQAAS